LDKIQDLEKEEKSIREKMKVDKEKNEEKKNLAQEKEKIENMPFDAIIDHYQAADTENVAAVVENYKIPNNMKTRKMKKRIIKNIQDHFVSENLNRRLKYQSILSEILKEAKGEVDDEKEKELSEIKNFILKNFTH